MTLGTLTEPNPRKKVGLCSLKPDANLGRNITQFRISLVAPQVYAFGRYSIGGNPVNANFRVHMSIGHNIQDASQLCTSLRFWGKMRRLRSLQRVFCVMPVLWQDPRNRPVKWRNLLDQSPLAWFTFGFRLSTLDFPLAPSANSCRVLRLS